MTFLLQWLGSAIAIAAAVWIVPGTAFIGGSGAWMSAAAVALFLALINLSIKPLLQVLSLPVSVLTLGIFALVVNALMLELASWLSEQYPGHGHLLRRLRVSLLRRDHRFDRRRDREQPHRRQGLAAPATPAFL